MNAFRHYFCCWVFWSLHCSHSVFRLLLCSTSRSAALPPSAVVQREVSQTTTPYQTMEDIQLPLPVLPVPPCKTTLSQVHKSQKRWFEVWNILSLPGENLHISSFLFMFIINQHYWSSFMSVSGFYRQIYNNTNNTNSVDFKNTVLFPKKNHFHQEMFLKFWNLTSPYSHGVCVPLMACFD